MRRADSYKWGLGGQAEGALGAEEKAGELLMGAGVRGRPQDTPTLQAPPHPQHRGPIFCISCLSELLPAPWEDHGIWAQMLRGG